MVNQNSPSAIRFQAPSYSLDYSRPIVGFGNYTNEFVPGLRCQIDQGITESKLRLWETAQSTVLSRDISQHDLDTDTLLATEYYSAISLLDDKTIYAYANFRFDNKPLALRWYQDLLLSDRHKRILFIAANQIGKSLTLDVDAACEFSKDHDKEWVGILVSKSLDQSQFQMDRIKNLLNTGNFTYKEENTQDTKTGKKDNSFQITYTFYTEDNKPMYTNRLICCPPTGSALGYPTDIMWLDEFDFWKDIDQDWFMKQIAIPRTFETGGAIKVFTNPDGQKYAYHLWNAKDRDGEYIWHRYNFNYWDRPGACQKDFDYKSADMTQTQIESTLLAVFSNSEKAFFNETEIKNSIKTDLTQASMFNKQVFAFMDVGAKHDQTVFMMGYVEPDEHNPRLKHIYVPIIQEYPVGYPLTYVSGAEPPSQNWPACKSVKDYIREWSGDGHQVMFGLDCTGNSGIVPLFKSQGMNPIDVTFTGPRKSGMYQRLKYFMEKGLFHRIKNAKFDNEFRTLEMKKSLRGFLMIHHAKEDDLDDFPDCAAGLVYLADNPDVFPVSATMVEAKPKTLSASPDTDETKEINNKEQRQKDIDNYMRNTINSSRSYLRRYG